MKFSVIFLSLLFVISINVDLLSASRHLLDQPAAVVDTVPGAPAGVNFTVAAADAPALMALLPAALSSDSNLASVIENLPPTLNITDLPAVMNFTAVPETPPSILPNDKEAVASPPVMSANDAIALMSTVAQLQNISLDIPDFSLPPLPPVDLPSYPEISIFGHKITVPPFLNFTTMFSTEDHP